MQTKLDALMFGVRDCHSTLEVQALARTIAQMLEEEARAEEDAEPGTPRREKEQGARAEPTLQAQARCGRRLMPHREDHASGIGELAQAAINAKGREAPAVNLPMPCGAASSVPPGVAEERCFQRRSRRPPMRLRQRLAGLLQAETLCRRYPAVAGRRIDTRRLCRIEAGDARIFVREVAGLKTDTAVQILVDRSGSMGSSRGQREVRSPASDRSGAGVLLCHRTRAAAGAGRIVAAAAFPGNGDTK